MALLSLDTVKRLLHAVTDNTAGNELASAANNSNSLAAQSADTCAALIVATSTSTTTNFAALKVGDKVLHVPAVAGNSSFLTVATTGTLPAAAVIGDLYVVLRSWTAPTPSAVVL